MDNIPPSSDKETKVFQVHTQLLSRNPRRKGKGGQYGQSSFCLYIPAQGRHALCPKVRVHEEHPGWNRWLFEHMHINLPINLVLANATCFTSTYVNIHGMKQRAAAERTAGATSIAQPTVTAPGWWKDCRGHHRFPWIPSELLLAKIVFLRTDHFIISKTILHFWGRMKNITHLKLPRLSSVSVILTINQKLSH